MPHNEVTLVAYASAAALSLIFTAFLLYSTWAERWRWPIAAAAAVQTLWLTIVAASLARLEISGQVVLTLEAIYFLGWITGLSVALHFLRPDPWPPHFKLSLLLAGGTFALATIDIWVAPFETTQVYFFCFLVLSLLALVTLEQLVRNAQSGRFIKLLGISLALVFLFSVYLYAQGIINRRVDHIAWQARAALLIASCFLVVSAGLLFRDSKTEPSGLGISRPVAFYSTSLLLSSVCVTLLAVGGYYVRNLGGHWGIYLFTLLLFGSLVGLSAVFLSNHVRSAIQVWISKHFFRHKYDYRHEWLNVIKALSGEPQSSAVYRTVYRVLANTFQSSGGEVWVRQSNSYRCAYRQSSEPRVNNINIPDDAPFIDIMWKHEWVFAPHAPAGPLSEHNSSLPDWITENQHVQLILPLISQSQLVGFVVLEKEGLDTDLTWEDLDILKTIGRQLANHILIHQQEEQLSESRQLDTYNKLSAFIMHDLNNLVAQLDLVVKNSERHKSNPAFIDDMILTVGNSVNRMKKLIQKLNRAEQDAPSVFSVVEALKASVEACGGGIPVPQLTVNGSDQDIQADRERFILAFKHLIKNAQEATPESGTVEVTVSAQPDQSLAVVIEDTGTGMSQEFIEHQLFKPFETTKTGQGIGIGVYLTRTYLEEIGASMEVNSAPGFGTSITVHFTQRCRERLMPASATAV